MKVESTCEVCGITWLLKSQTCSQTFFNLKIKDSQSWIFLECCEGFVFGISPLVLKQSRMFCLSVYLMPTLSVHENDWYLTATSLLSIFFFIKLQKLIPFSIILWEAEVLDLTEIFLVLLSYTLINRIYFIWIRQPGYNSCMWMLH